MNFFNFFFPDDRLLCIEIYMRLNRRCRFAQLQHSEFGHSTDDKRIHADFDCRFPLRKKRQHASAYSRKRKMLNF